MNTTTGSATVGWGGGMWWTRCAEMYGQSPYHFAGNNPINNMETNGAVWQEAVADGIERDIDEWGNVASGGTGTRTTYRGPTTFFGSGGYYGNYEADNHVFFRPTVSLDKFGWIHPTPGGIEHISKIILQDNFYEPVKITK
jgi:hypothetical protein